MGKIIKALILGWIGKKIYDRVSADDEPEKAIAHPKRAAPKRTSARKPARRAPRAA